MDVRFPCMRLYASPAPLRGTSKFSSLRHSKRMPRIRVHHYCYLYVVVDSDDKLNVSCVLFCSPPSSSYTISGFSASWCESCSGDLQNFISTSVLFCAFSEANIIVMGYLTKRRVLLKEQLFGS